MTATPKFFPETAEAFVALLEARAPEFPSAASTPPDVIRWHAARRSLVLEIKDFLAQKQKAARQDVRI